MENNWNFFNETKFLSGIRIFKNLDGISLKLINEKYINKVSKLFLNVFKNELNFAFLTLKENEKEKLTEQLKGNLYVFKENFKIIVNLIIENIWKSYETNSYIDDFVNKINKIEIQKLEMNEIKEEEENDSTESMLNKNSSNCSLKFKEKIRNNNSLKSESNVNSSFIHKMNNSQNDEDLRKEEINKNSCKRNYSFSKKEKKLNPAKSFENKKNNKKSISKEKKLVNNQLKNFKEKKYEQVTINNFYNKEKFEDKFKKDNLKSTPLHNNINKTKNNYSKKNKISKIQITKFNKKN